MARLLWEGKAAPARTRLPLETLEWAGGRNRLILGDSRQVLPGLLPRFAGKVDLVYLDPPFASGADYSVAGRKAYRDTWRGGFDSYLQWLYATAVLLRDLLARTGSLYLHLDANASHYAKAILDEVFGAENFQREIVWRIGWVSGYKAAAANWIRNHDTLLFYVKDRRRFTFNKQYLPYPPGYVRRDGRAPKGRGFPLDDVWNASQADRLDSIQIKSFSGEKVGYPTQKNEALLERIIAASSNPGGLVLDCCCGSGTTPAVASRLGRRFIAADLGRLAIDITRKRLLAAAAPFSLQSHGKHERRAWLAATFGDDLDGYRRFIAALAGARGKVHVGAVDATWTRAAVAALGEGPLDVLGWAFEPGLASSARVRLRQIPREVMEAAAVSGVRPEDFRALRAVEARVRVLRRVARVVLGSPAEVDSWAVDWHHRGGVFRVGFHAARSRKGAALPPAAESPPYARPGRYVVAVKVIDASLTETVRRFPVEVR